MNIYLKLLPFLFLLSCSGDFAYNLGFACGILFVIIYLGRIPVLGWIFAGAGIIALLTHLF